MLALVNKDRDYQELSVEDIELAVAEIDNINAIYNCKPSWLMLIYCYLCNKRSHKVKSINVMQIKFSNAKTY